MRVLLIGAGGREHAIAQSLSNDPAINEVICAPGNPGMADIASRMPVDLTNPVAIANLAVAQDVDLVVIGPEAPLVAGAADLVRSRGIACFGPSADAAAIEGSKEFAKDVMRAAKVPTATAHACRTETEVIAALDGFGPPYVVKDDGLAAGKGVVVTTDRDAAIIHARSCDTVLIEEYLDGPEVSLFVITDGTTAVPMLPAQDFKRVNDNDTGSNTGGMGAYTPLPWAPEGLVDEIMGTIAKPTLKRLTELGKPFSGVLYCGIALTKTGPKVIEFNCRFGDPEIQAILPLLATNLGGLLHSAATGKLAEHPPLVWRDQSAVNVVIAAEGYPATPATGRLITGADNPNILHAGTARDKDGNLVSAGGRVLNCVATGDTLADARTAAYRLVESIDLAGSHHRTDIAEQAVKGTLS